jgi:hypothetical protein
MPARKLLEGSAFTPDEFGELARLFDEIVTALSLKSHVDREALARTILLIASEQQFSISAKFTIKRWRSIAIGSPPLARRR